MTDLNLYVVTFNCGRALIEPDAFGRHLFDGWQAPVSTGTTYPDVVVLNLQEIAPIGYAFLGHNWVNPYFDHFRKAVKIASGKFRAQQDGEDLKYINLMASNAGLTAIMIFVKEDLVSEVRALNVAEVGVGVSEMGNKGAIGMRVGWKVPDTNFLMYTTFVSAHLAPFEAEIERRDQDYRNIVRGLVFSNEDARDWKKGQSNAEDVPLLEDEAEDRGSDSSKPIGMYASDTHLFFAGDLNYRTAFTSPGRDDSKHFPRPTDDGEDLRHYKQLLDKDQLSQQLHSGKTLHGLKEQEIEFPPTYKYHASENQPVLQDEDVDEWQWASHRWPSWCDRVLFASTQVQAGKYSALPIFRTSDHRPVALSASVPLQPLSNPQFPSEAPAPLDQDATARRTSARRKEIVVGIAAYLGLTWEGRSILIGAVLFVLGGLLMARSME